MDGIGSVASGTKEPERSTTPWMEDDYMDVGGRATSGTVAEVETRLEQRSRSQSRSQNLGVISLPVGQLFNGLDSRFRGNDEIQ